MSSTEHDETADESLDREAVDAVAELLGSGAAPEGGRERLVQAVGSSPLRYGPFYEPLGELFDLDEPAIEALLSRIEGPKSFKPSGLPGVRVIDVVGGPATRGLETLLVRFAPGARFPKHRHQGRESVLLIEGGYTDDDGRDFRAGDRHDMEDGSMHGFRIWPDGPCIAAARLGGPVVFESLPLRLLAKIVGRG